MGKTLAAIITIAVVVAIAVFAPELTPAFLAAAVGTSTAIAITTAVLSVAASLLLSFAFGALGVGAPKAKDSIGPPTVFRQAITNSFIVYGKRRVGGLLVFFHARQSGSDHFRYFVIAVAGHRCKQVDSWMLSDETVTVDGSNKVTSGKYANAAWLWFQRGLAAETANATFVSECGGNWTTDHKGNDVAAVYAKFQMTDDVVQAGMPNITEVIEGRDEILDYRDGSIGYTRNGGLVFYDWMLMPREEGGFGAYDDEMPLASYIAAQANVCDETVHSNPRYALDAVITTGAAPAEVRDAMIVNCAGSYTYSGGKHQMRVGYWVPVTASLSEDDLAGPIQVTPFFPADTAANEVQGTFIDPSTGYQGAAFTTQSVAAADVKQLDLDLAFTTVRDQANRVARIMLNRAQCEKQVVWPMNIAGLAVKAMQTVQFDTPRYSLSNYAFVVSNWSFSADFGAVISGREENAEIYDDPTPVSPSSPPTIVQPTGPLSTSTDIQNLIALSAPTGLTLTVGTSSGGNVPVTISNHTRVYSDKSVSVTGNSGPVNVSASTGDLIIAYYDDPDRAGGAVTYHYLILAGGVGDASTGYASPTNPYRHTVFAIKVQSTSTSGGSDAGSGGTGGTSKWENTGTL